MNSIPPIPRSKPINLKFLNFLRTLSLIEGTSTLLLFLVAMPLKYMAGMPLVVTIFGSIHGLLFIGLVALFLIGLGAVPIPRRLAIAGVIGAVVPFGPFVVERWLKRFAEGK